MACPMKCILVITSWEFQDALIQTYVLPYLRIIQKKNGQSVGFVLVTQEKRSFNNKLVILTEVSGTINYKVRYNKFGFLALLKWGIELVRIIIFSRKLKIDCVHAWCTPAGSIGYLISLVLRIPLIVDSYEPHADAMVENGTWSKTGIAFKTLFLLEKLQTRHAKHLVAASRNMRDYAKVRYGHTKNNILIKPACVDFDIFRICHDKQGARERLNLPSGTLMVYAGKFGGIYFDSEIIQFAWYLRKFHFHDLELLLLTNTEIRLIHKWCSEIGFPISNVVIKFVNHSEISAYIAAADFAITPVKPVSSKRCCSPVKNGEYWACGLPVLISPNISDDSDQIKSNNIGVICFFDQPTTYNSSLDKLKALLDSESPEQLSQRIRDHALSVRNYSIAENVYDQIYR